MMNGGTVLYLNVGGVYYATHRSTLANSSSTFFSALARAHPDDTEVFVDRDPSLFRHVLNWLRGVRHLPEDDMALRELEWEADYYCMRDLSDAIARTRERYSMARTLCDIRDELRQR
jgi:hypothetical protein